MERHATARYLQTGSLKCRNIPTGRHSGERARVGNMYPTRTAQCAVTWWGMAGAGRRNGTASNDADGNLTERYLGTGRWLDGRRTGWRYRWNADGSLAKVVTRQEGGGVHIRRAQAQALQELRHDRDAVGGNGKTCRCTSGSSIGNIPSKGETGGIRDTGTPRHDGAGSSTRSPFVPVAMIKEGRSHRYRQTSSERRRRHDAEGNEVWSWTWTWTGTSSRRPATRNGTVPVPGTVL